MSQQVQPEKLRPVLHEKIDRMNGEELTMLQQLLENLEETWRIGGELGKAFDQDQAQGKFRRLDEVIREFRKSHRYA